MTKRACGIEYSDDLGHSTCCDTVARGTSVGRKRRYHQCRLPVWRVYVRQERNEAWLVYPFGDGLGIGKTPVGIFLPDARFGELAPLNQRRHDPKGIRRNGND